jgi:hypothetical protein
MYEWITHMWGALDGCPHQCAYCYEAQRRKRYGKTFPQVPRLREPFPYMGGDYKTIFVCHTSDLFAAEVPVEYIEKVIAHCMRWTNQYVFQTKNPARLTEELAGMPMPKMAIIGTTIETNREELTAKYSRTPTPYDRAAAMRILSERFTTFVTIEPILAFDYEKLAELILWSKVDFVNVGADSKGCGLQEPSDLAVAKLLCALFAGQVYASETSDPRPVIIGKPNLDRILPGACAILNDRSTRRPVITMDRFKLRGKP